jgi:hypothetical protein
MIVKRASRAIRLAWQLKLAKPVTHYAVELAKGNRSAEIVVDPGGATVEPAKWGPKEE